MKRNPFFLLREINGQAFLLPFGQGIASHLRGVKINESGVFLWNALEKDLTKNELLSLFAEHYEASEEDLSELSADLDICLDMLIKNGSILPDSDPWAVSASLYKELEIAGLRIRLEGPADVFDERLLPFAVQSCPAELQSRDISSSKNTPDLGQAKSSVSGSMTVTAFAGICPYENPGHMLLRNSMLSILDCGPYYELQFHVNQQVKTLILKKDGSKAIFYYALPHEDRLREELFHGIREAFLYLATLHGMAAIHSASILYRGKAFLFSGHSGMGKSTHAALWHGTKGVPILNGDLNLIGLQDGKPVIFGIPWCGTSEISDQGTHPLGGIILLRRDVKNHTQELAPCDQVLLVDQRLISHSWTEDLFNANLSLIQKIAPEILICSLYCTKDLEAVAVMQERIDRAF